MAATALGGATTASGTESVSMGYNTFASAKSALAIGQYNIGSGNGTSWVASDPVFEIGIGSSDASRANALTVLKNGNVGIGPASPTAKLEVGGQVKITGGSPGAGKVLTSDADGLASWQSPGGGSFALPFSGSASESPGPVLEITNTGSGTGIRGISSSGDGIMGVSEAQTGNGVFGLAHSTTGENYAIRGETDSPDGYSGYFIGNKFFVSGNVGINTLNPACQLQVNSASVASIISLTTEASGKTLADGLIIGTQYQANNPSNQYAAIINQENSPLIIGTNSDYSQLILDTNGNLGIGADYPGAKLEVGGQVKITGGSPGAGKVLTSDADGLASWQTPSGSGFSLPYSGNGSTENNLLEIENTGTGDGIFSKVQSGIAVRGYKSVLSDYGIGVLGEANTIHGSGIYGYSYYSSGDGKGVFGQSASSTGIGIEGYVNHTSGITKAVYGLVESPAGYSGYFDGSKFYISGNTGIGTENPQKKLHIHAQNGSNSFLITSDGTGSTASDGLEISTLQYEGPGEKYAKIMNHENSFLILGTANQEEIYIGNSGSVGIGGYYNAAKLYVDGTIMVTGGNPGAGKVLTSDEYGLASWETPSEGGLTLPYSGSVSTTAGTALVITNTGTGSGIMAITASGTDVTMGVSGTTGSTRGSGVMGSAISPTGSSYGVYGSSSSTSGHGIYGIATASSGTTYGVHGVSASPNGYSGYFEGAKFYVDGNAGIGIPNPSAKLEVAGQVKITGGDPGAGKVLTSDASGLATWEDPSLELPYFGVASAVIPIMNIFNEGGSSAINGVGGSAGVVGQTNSGNDAKGVEGLANSTTESNFGVYGQSYSTSGTGVYGYGSSSSGTNYGIRGRTLSSGGYSGYFEGGKFYVEGNTGIGNPSPSYKLDVTGNRIRLINGSKWLAMRTDGSAGILDFSYSGGNLTIQGSAAGEDVLLNPSQASKVGIRTWIAAYDLDVNGDIRATGSVYYGGTSGNANGNAYNKPDYVFSGDYPVMMSDDVEAFLKKENHLPWVTSAKQEKEENGEVTDMTRMAFETLESVENLQLQLIEQNKLITMLRESNNLLKAENEQISGRLERLENQMSAKSVSKHKTRNNK